jgi:hypothetical protein
LICVASVNVDAGYRSELLRARLADATEAAEAPEQRATPCVVRRRDRVEREAKRARARSFRW